MVDTALPSKRSLEQAAKGREANKEGLFRAKAPPTNLADGFGRLGAFPIWHLHVGPGVSGFLFVIRSFYSQDRIMYILGAVGSYCQ